jgi:hypothetical protein
LSLSSICIPSSVDRLCQLCFSRCEALSVVTFERGSPLSRIDRSAFFNCLSLSSICIPSSVRQLRDRFFQACRSLQEATFESGSKVSRVGDCAFESCPSLSLIRIPSSRQPVFSAYVSRRAVVPGAPGDPRSAGLE